MEKYGNFGIISDFYELGRKDYPKEVFDYFFKEITEEKTIKILDLGCGNGLSTRQIKNYFNRKNIKIIGLDKDALMIKKALSYKDGIEYVKSSAEKIPFKDNYFDLITAFGAFHWFSTKKEIQEVKRVLNKNGMFVVVNKNSILIEKIKQIISKEIKINIPNIKKGYDPYKILTLNNFVRIRKFKIDYDYKYTLEEAFNYYYSMSFSNLVPKDEKCKVGKLLKDLFLSVIDKENNVIWKQEVVLVCGLNIK